MGLALLLLAAGLSAVLIGGCGGGDSPSASAKSAAGPAKNATIPAIPDSPPDIEVPPGLPPKNLVVRDLEKGTGKEAHKGDEVGIEYYGIEWNSGLEHANSWRYSARPFFKLGEDRNLLRGLVLAIPGMREGGSREVIIPHDLVYYSGGHHRPLGRLDALIYKVYLVRVFDGHRG